MEMFFVSTIRSIAVAAALPIVTVTLMIAVAPSFTDIAFFVAVIISSLKAYNLSVTIT